MPSVRLSVQLLLSARFVLLVFAIVFAAAAEALFQRSGKLRHFLALAAQPQKP